MELDNLKSLWKEQEAVYLVPNNEQIVSMLQKRSQSPVAKMKRNLYWEMVSVVLLYTATIAYYIFQWGTRYWEIVAFLAVIGAFFLFYYVRKHKLLSEMQCVVCEVQTNLKRQLNTLEKYVRFYMIAGTVLAPISYVVSGMIVLTRPPSGKSGFLPAGSEFSLSYSSYILFILVGIIIAVSSYFVNVWYVNKLYGRHIEKLRRLLAQMEELD